MGAAPNERDQQARNLCKHGRRQSRGGSGLGGQGLGFGVWVATVHGLGGNGTRLESRVYRRIGVVVRVDGRLGVGVRGEGLTVVC